MNLCEVTLNIKWSLRDHWTIFQTLIVLSGDPDTILVPSGENAVVQTQLVWASVFSLSSPSFPAGQANQVSVLARRKGELDFELAAHRNPRS